MFNRETSQQYTMFNQPLVKQIDINNRFCLINNNLKWNKILDKLEKFYKDGGRSSIPVRRMVALNIVKFLDNLSDDQVIKAYKENPYIQVLCGNIEFSNEDPCDSTSLSIFRRRIGVEGCDLIFSESVSINDVNLLESEVIVDTTSQPKNITFPTDIKLLNKVIQRCLKHAKKFGIKLNNTYRSEVKELLKTLRFEKRKSMSEEIKKARRRIITIAGRLVREIDRKMTDSQRDSIQNDLSNYYKVIEQSKGERKPSAAEKNQLLDDLQEAIETCEKVAKENGLKLSQNFNDQAEKLLSEYRNSAGRGREQTYKNALNGLKKFLRNLIKKLEKGLSMIKIDGLRTDLFHFKNLAAKPVKKEKIYSLHEPHVACIAKGKAGKPYEFGSKASIALTKNSSIIVGAVNFSGNPHDSNTVALTMQHIEKITGQKPENVYADRGYKGSQDKNPDISIHLPSAPKKDATEDEKNKAREDFCRRSSIEPVIGHVKNDFRLARTFLKGVIGDKINLSLSCAAFNFQKFINSKLAKIEAKRKKKSE